MADDTVLMLALLGAGLAPHASAAPASFRIASGFDPQTMDPHALALLYHVRVVHQLYEPLINRDEQFRIEPALAVSWQMLSPTTWRFELVFSHGPLVVNSPAVRRRPHS